MIDIITRWVAEVSRRAMSATSKTRVSLVDINEATPLTRVWRVVNINFDERGVDANRSNGETLRRVEGDAESGTGDMRVAVSVDSLQEEE